MSVVLAECSAVVRFNMQFVGKITSLNMFKLSNSLTYFNNFNALFFKRWFKTGTNVYCWTLEPFADTKCVLFEFSYEHNEDTTCSEVFKKMEKLWGDANLNRTVTNRVVKLHKHQGKTKKTTKTLGTDLKYFYFNTIQKIKVAVEVAASSKTHRPAEEQGAMNNMKEQKTKQKTTVRTYMHDTHLEAQRLKLNARHLG